MIQIELNYMNIIGEFMAIELQFNSVTIQAGDRVYPVILSSLQPYLPVQFNPSKKHRRKRKTKTVASFIDSIIADIEQGAQK